MRDLDFSPGDIASNRWLLTSLSKSCCMRGLSHVAPYSNPRHATPPTSFNTVHPHATMHAHHVQSTAGRSPAARHGKRHASSKRTSNSHSHSHSHSSTHARCKQQSAKPMADATNLVRTPKDSPCANAPMGVMRLSGSRRRSASCRGKSPAVHTGRTARNNSRSSSSSIPPDTASTPYRTRMGRPTHSAARRAQSTHGGPPSRLPIAKARVSRRTASPRVVSRRTASISNSRAGSATVSTTARRHRTSSEGSDHMPASSMRNGSSSNKASAFMQRRLSFGKGTLPLRASMGDSSVSRVSLHKSPTKPARRGTVAAAAIDVSGRDVAAPSQSAQQCIDKLALLASGAASDMAEPQQQAAAPAAAAAAAASPKPAAARPPVVSHPLQVVRFTRVPKLVYDSCGADGDGTHTRNANGQDAPVPDPYEVLQVSRTVHFSAPPFPHPLHHLCAHAHDSVHVLLRTLYRHHCVRFEQRTRSWPHGTTQTEPNRASTSCTPPPMLDVHAPSPRNLT